MHSVGIDLIWSALPIPIVLMYATWLRAPDWISENKRWSARIRAASVVLVPMAALLVAVPVYRVQQVPTRIRRRVNDLGRRRYCSRPALTSSNSRRDQSEFEIRQGCRRSLSQGRRGVSVSAKDAQPRSQVDSGPSGMARHEQKPLQWALEANGHTYCFFGDPLTEMELPPALMHGSSAE